MRSLLILFAVRFKVAEVLAVALALAVISIKYMMIKVIHQIFENEFLIRFGINIFICEFE